MKGGSTLIRICRHIRATGEKFDDNDTTAYSLPLVSPTADSLTLTPPVNSVDDSTSSPPSLSPPTGQVDPPPLRRSSRRVKPPERLNL